jgi:hypothetical protein
MPEEKNIQLTPEALAILADLQSPDWLLQEVAQAMDEQNQYVVSKIQQQRLTGRGPFPPEEHRLGVRTGRLRSAAWASPATVTGTSVACGIGDNVKYAAIHEFGGRIVRKPFTGKVRLRTDAAGELLRQLTNPKLLVFAKKTHKRAKEVQYQSAGYTIEMPERAPFRTEIGERLDDYGRAVSRAIVDAWGERAK